jgi:hypothetical protein
MREEHHAAGGVRDHGRDADLVAEIVRPPTRCVILAAEAEPPR